MHSFHLVDSSPWPLMAGLNLMSMATGTAMWFNMKDSALMSVALLIMFLISYLWWRDVSREGSYQGIHTSTVMSNLRVGMVMFIVSEIFFFFSFFWGFFHFSLAADVELGLFWPPMGVESFLPSGIPLLNTIILVSSGVTITWAHHSLLNKEVGVSEMSLFLTILLGIYFTVMQLFEYKEAMFTLADSVYGSIFFVMTGFHGVHVLVGTLFIFIMFIRVKKCFVSSGHHVGFEMAAWYWHFVDVVWLLLYILLYWWGT